MAAQTVSARIEAILRARERNWAWLGRRIGTRADRIWRLRRGEVPWRQHEALAAADALQMPFSALFGNGEDVLPHGYERRRTTTDGVRLAASGSRGARPASGVPA